MPSLKDEDKKRIAVTLWIFFKSCNIFGKKEVDFEFILESFCYVLKKYEIDNIMDSLEKWFSSSSTFPAPADIVRIIEDPLEWNYAAVKAIEEKKKAGVLTTPYENTYVEEASKPNRAKYAPKSTAAPTANYHMDLEEQLNASPINRKILGMFAKTPFYKSYVQGTHANFTDLGNNELRLTLLRSKEKFLETYEDIVNKAGYTIKEVLVTS